MIVVAAFSVLIVLTAAVTALRILKKEYLPLLEELERSQEQITHLTEEDKNIWQGGDGA